MFNHTATSPEKLGWVPSPTSRGTIDIIWSCSLVLFACTWTVLHTNLPEEGESIKLITLRKIRWAIWALFSPEIVMVGAAYQWSSARASMKEMQAEGHLHWKMAHSFFADSGGFLLRCPHYPPFPIQARGIMYLVSQNHIPVPKVTRREILDRSKTNKLGKTLALMQSLYLVCQVVARYIQGLEISSLEILTLSFLSCTIPTYIFWLEKPLDCDFPVYIDLNIPISTILAAADIADETYRCTPLDFVEGTSLRAWNRRQCFNNAFGLKQQPLRRVPNDSVPVAGPCLALIVWLFTLLHAAIQVSAWNIEVPTEAENILWRTFSISILLEVFFWGIIDMISIWPGFNYTITLFWIWEKRTTRTDSFWHRWALNGLSMAGTLVYFAAKLGLIVLSLTTLRQMPQSVYNTVRWTSFLPHW
ncbi:hypothetical protein BGZ61DRAFT_364844 [Ilyonectria robusta]|uniref:uncharacterized protein n=1 Tax=Ilyonectria robusta TaxID=1079257 RepID=UPI001E8D6D18|nr:uncharacterized protein BGZ61DRAFT_364844 [Ilyonectria robusta]KAH8667716.1 hypothetical protein BGZ61DRAFT_364844 [Ilyonectria robusta]